MSLEHSPAKIGTTNRRTTPDSIDRMLRAPEVMAIMGWSRTTLWRRVRDGAFFAPQELGPNSIGWTESRVKAARDALPRRIYGR